VERDGDASSTAALTSELGKLQEKAGNIAEAVDLWRQAFAAGCTDLKIADRFTKLLLREGRDDEVRQVLSQVLGGDPKGDLADRLSRRLSRCQPKAERAPEPAARLDAERRPYRCSVCGDYGHNRRSCSKSSES
jgi:hypothetical protein